MGVPLSKSNVIFNLRHAALHEATYDTGQAFERKNC